MKPEITLLTKQLIVISFFILTLTGCATMENDAASSTPSYPVKSVADASFSFDAYERKRAIRAYNHEHAHLLLQLIINRNGDIVNLRLVRSSLDDYQTGALKSYARSMKFDPAPENDTLPYRALFYPIHNSAYDTRYIIDPPTGFPRPVEPPPSFQR